MADRSGKEDTIRLRSAPVRDDGVIGIDSASADDLHGSDLRSNSDGRLGRRFAGGRGRLGVRLPGRATSRATSRAGLAAVNRRYRGHRILVVGLGGTCGYVLGQVAYTEVDTILLIDGDRFDNHNAFRAPGAPN